MQNLRQQLNRLSTESPDAAAYFLRSAFAYARPDEQTPLARLLLKTGRVEAIRAVLARLDSLELDDADLREVPAQPLHAALHNALFFAEHDLCTNALFCIRRRKHPADAALFVETPPRKERDLPAYGMTLLALVTSALGAGIQRRPADADRAMLERAAIRLLNVHNGHRLPSIRLAAAMLAHEPGPVLAEELRRRDSIVAPALRGVVDLIEDEQVQSLLVKWLSSPVLGRTVARRLGDLVTPERFDCVFRDAVLLRTPARRAMLRQIDRPLRILSSAGAGASSARAEAMLDIAQSVDLTHQTRLERVRQLLAFADARTGIRARLALAAMEVAGADDEDHPAVRCVQRALNWRTDREISTEASASIASPLSRIASLREASSSAASFWAHWRSLPDAPRRVAARAALHADRADFLEQLRLAMIQLPTGASLQVLALVRRLHLERDVELELLALAGSADDRLASFAVSILAGSDVPSRTGVIRAALQRGTGRIRANAVPASTSRLRTAVDVDSVRDPRLRVNAILAEQAAPDEPLAGVLRDERPDHRRSAIWAAGRRGGAQCLVELKRLSTTEADEFLRERAGRALRLLSLRLDAGHDAPVDRVRELKTC